MPLNKSCPSRCLISMVVSVGRVESRLGERCSPLRTGSETRPHWIHFLLTGSETRPTDPFYKGMTLQDTVPIIAFQLLLRPLLSSPAILYQHHHQHSDRKSPR